MMTYDILVVEDLSMWREIFTEALSDLCNITFADKFSDARRKISNGNYRVIILDNRLEDSDRLNVQGIKLLKHAKLVNPDTKIVMVTGYPDDVPSDVIHKYQLDYFMLKETFDIDIFRANIQTLLG